MISVLFHFILSILVLTEIWNSPFLTKNVREHFIKKTIQIIRVVKSRNLFLRCDRPDGHPRFRLISRYPISANFFDARNLPRFVKICGTTGTPALFSGPLSASPSRSSLLGPGARNSVKYLSHHQVLWCVLYGYVVIPQWGEI